MEEKSNSKQVTFKYIFAKDYDSTYANGAYGGLGVNNEINMHFYHERPGIPKETEVVFDSVTGATIKENSKPDFKVVRIIDCGITMNLESAKAFHAWLGGIISSAEAKK